MRFQYFRIVVTILAAFGAFFSYVCRLNLSLAIEKMVVKNESDIKIESSVDSQIVELKKDFPSLNTEEQTLSELSNGIWWKRRKAYPLEISPIKLNQTYTTKNTLKKFRPTQSPIVLLFDISGNGNSQEINEDANANATNNNDSQNNDQVDQIPLARQQNLLNWSEGQKNDLLGAFFFGYVIFQIPSGYAAEQFGAKLLFMWVAIGTGLTSILFPLASKWADGSIVLPWLIRFIMGASQAGLFPACYVLLCEWLPKSERTSWLAVPSAMSRFGTIVMNFVVPITIETFGWETVFYLCGCVTLMWGFFFMLFSSDTPGSSCWLSQKELLFIESRMEPQFGSITMKEQTMVSGSGFSINEASKKTVLKKPPINWFKMLKSKPLLILSLVMFTSEWSNLLLLIKLPGFLGPVLKMDLSEIGFWSSILVGIYCVQYPLSGVCASKLESAEIAHLNSLRVRKIFEVIAHLLQAFGCLLIAFNTGRTIIIVALCIMMLGRSTVGGGQCLMPPELSKDYPGSVMALANSIANSAGIFGPMIVNALVEDPTDYNSWQILWLLSASIFVFGGVVFCIFADNKPQNYSKRPKPGSAISQAQLFFGGGNSSVPVDEQILKMDAFTRVGCEPSTDPSGRSNRHARGRGRGRGQRRSTG